MRTSQAKRRDSRHVIVPTPIIFRRLPKGLVVTTVANLFPPQKKSKRNFHLHLINQSLSVCSRSTRQKWSEDNDFSHW